MPANNNQKLSVRIETASIFKVILVILLFVALFILSDIVLVILTAVLIASAIEPATRWFGKHRIHRIPAVLIIYLGGVSVLTFIFYFLFVPLLNEAVNFLKTFPGYLSGIEVWNPIANNLSDNFSIQEIINQTNLALSGTFNFLGAISIVFGGILSLILIVILSFYLSVQENGVIKFLRFVIPLKHEKYIVDLWRRAEIKIGLWAQGQIVLALVVGVLTYLGLVLLGIPNALLLAFLAGILEIIPLFGPMIAAVPAVILGFTTGGFSLALLVVGFYVIVQQFESQLIYPLVVKKIIGLSPIIVILALSAGFKLAGFLGMILFVPLTTILLIFLEDLERKKHGQSVNPPNQN